VTEVVEMEKIKFSKEEKAMMIQKVKMYFYEELNQEIGNFDAEFLIDFFAEEIGGFFYNRGLYDAETVISEKVSDISDLLFQLEKPVSIQKST
jgi:uncharacterized protein (DUF2164 family)